MTYLRFYLMILCTGLLLLVLYSVSGYSNSKVNKNKVKPLLVLEDQNIPSLNYNGTRVVAGPEIGMSEVFDVNTGKLLGSYKIERSDTAVLSPDGKKVRIFHDTLGEQGKSQIAFYQTTFDVDTGKIISQSKTDVNKNGKFVRYMGVSRYGPHIYRSYTSDLSTVAGAYPIYTKENKPDQPAIIVGNIETHTVICELYATDGFVERDDWTETAMTPDGKFVASTRFNYNDNSRNKTIVWDTEKKKIIFELPFHCSWLSMSAEGSKLVTKNRKEGGQIEIWNITTGKKISTVSEMVNGRKVQVGNHGEISPDGKLLVTSRAEEIMIWDTETGARIAAQDQSRYSESLVRSPTFSGDGKRLAVGSDTEVITIWSVDEILKNGNPLAF